jgi:hypothetical protein
LGATANSTRILPDFSTKPTEFGRIFGRGAAEKVHGAYPYRCLKTR